MLSLHRIEKQFHAGEHERLLRQVLDNGLRLPLPLRVRLSQGRATAIAMGLRRVVELTYGPGPLSRAMIAALLAEQSASGAFLADDRPDPLATAAAVSALAMVRRDHPTAAGPEVDEAHDRALAALSEMQDGDGLFRAGDDRSDADRARSAAFVLWLLAADAAFRQSVRMADVRNWFESRLSRLEATTAELYQLACLSRPIDPPRTPALAAIAA
ncbi:hypothetical protein ACERK3_04985 [Phycisphaerales bacterium AB-hyl4]|uniref:Uncharacterized protein n=1 Tax=Natronomicrosphaera hydrolytica TaxID=3242702 RepID=A0ABV4U216_9BACT